MRAIVLREVKQLRRKSVCGAPSRRRPCVVRSQCDVQHTVKPFTVYAQAKPETSGRRPKSTQVVTGRRRRGIAPRGIRRRPAFRFDISANTVGESFTNSAGQVLVDRRPFL